MLKTLGIKNIALISDITIEFGEGLNILTGETGAGKSLIIGSISLMLGERADRSIISHGREFASVEAVFEVKNDSPALPVMEELGLEVENTIIIYRKLFSDGRNECRVNGKAFTLSMLKKLTGVLMDLHGQFEHQSLLKQANHIKILDGYKHDFIWPLKQEIQKAYAEYSAVKKELSSFKESDEERERLIDLYNFQIKEITDAAFHDTEEEELKQFRDKVLNQEKISGNLKTASFNLMESENSVINSLSGALGALSTISSYDKTIEEQYNRLVSVKYEVSDIAETVNDFLSSMDFNEELAKKNEERLDLLRSLKRKYGSSINEINEFLETTNKEYNRLTNSFEYITKLKNKRDELWDKLKKLAKELTAKRKEVAALFEKDVIKELSSLGMNKTHFAVNFNPQSEDKINYDGNDDVEFLVSFNVGEPARPLTKIISGGEMARFMLGIKNIVADIDGINTMIFDEIDSGISGIIGKVVGEKLSKISGLHQVICVTHLAQVAAFADNHFKIEKFEKDGKTFSGVSLLSENERVNELARIIGGLGSSIHAKPHAQEILASANKYKN